MRLQHLCYSKTTNAAACGLSLPRTNFSTLRRIPHQYILALGSSDIKSLLIIIKAFFYVVPISLYLKVLDSFHLFGRLKAPKSLYVIVRRL